MERRQFLQKAALGTVAAVSAGALTGAPAVHAKERVRWKMVTTWPPKLPYLQDAAELLAKKVEMMSGGLFEIKVFAGGELVPPLQTFDAVSKGTAVQAGSGVGYYQAGKASAAQWFAAVPFGLNGAGMAAWYEFGGGLALWEEVYEPFNVIPRPGGTTGTQRAGWFNKKIESAADFKGLKMRIPGLGGKVMAEMGSTVILCPASEIFTNLERGVIDASEWIGPLHDQLMGFYKVAKYYYYPGWHEPGPYVEFVFNKTAYDALSSEYQAILDAACAQVNNWTTYGFNFGNAKALEELITQHQVTVLRIPDPVLVELKARTRDAIADIVAKDPMAKKVNDSFEKFRKLIGPWDEISEKVYHNSLADQFPFQA